MKKRLLLNSSLLVLSNAFVFTNSFMHPSHLSVQAQEATTIEEVYEVMTQQGPITDEQWNSIPAEDWLRYANEAGPTMYMDNIFYKAYNEHRWVFNSELNRIFLILSDTYGIDAYKFNRFIDNEFNALEVLVKAKYDDGSGIRFSKLAELIDTQNRGVSELTREQAIERVKSNNETEQMKINVLKLSSIDPNKINQVSDDMFFEAAVVHAMKNPLGGDYGTQLAVFKSLYPELYTFNEEIQNAKLPRTRNKAIELVESNGLDKRIPNFLSMGIKKETIDQIPENIFYEGAVQYLMTNANPDDITTVVQFFMSLYPEYFTGNAQFGDTKRQENLSKIQENKEKLLSEQSKTDINYLSLEDNQIFTFEEGEFKVTNVYLLVPGEAGNQSDNYLFGIHYEFTNKTDEDIIAPQAIFEQHSTTSQLTNNQPVQLNKGSYHIPFQDEENKENNTIFEDSFIVKSNESLEGTLYYEVPNTENDLIWSIIENNTVNSYRIITQDLQKLPYQSASYISNSDNQLGYLFDFERLYLVFSNSADTSNWENKEGVTINPDITSLSKEAKNHYNHLIEQLGNDITLITLENINYILEGGKINVTIGENEEVILELMTETKWDSFSDDSNNIFELVSIN